MKFLVDANVLSEATRPQPFAPVLDWLSDHEADLVVLPIVLGEIEYGIRLLASGRKKRELLQWFSAGVSTLRVVDFDAGTATAWAQLLAKLKHRGQAMPIKDTLIAASALQHGLTVVSRNVVDFKNAGVSVIDPFV